MFFPFKSITIFWFVSIVASSAVVIVISFTKVTFPSWPHASIADFKLSNTIDLSSFMYTTPLCFPNVAFSLLLSVFSIITLYSSGIFVIIPYIAVFAIIVPL